MSLATVEQLSTNMRKAYEGLGLKFLRRTEVNTNLVATLKHAFSRLEQLPSLYAESHISQMTSSFEDQSSPLGSRRQYGADAWR